MPIATEVHITAHTEFRKGDHLVYSNHDDWITDIKVGNKWMVIRGTEGALLARIDITQPIDMWVTREMPTDAELAEAAELKEQQKLAMQEEMFEDVIVKMEGKLKKANDELLKAMQLGYDISSAAEDQVIATELHMIANEMRQAREINPEMTWFEIFTHFVNLSKEWLVEGHQEPTYSGGFSFANARRQAKIAARRKFVKTLVWYSI